MGFVPFTFIDFIDIILVAAIMFWIYRATRGTNAPYIISGIIMIYLMWVVVRTLNMELLSNILGQFVSVGVIEGDRIVAAKCILPVTQSDVPKSYGTRHRAAIGMSEISDAIILVVSEETGGISIAHGGTIHRDIAPDQLANLLQRHFGANRQKDRHATMGS